MGCCGEACESPRQLLTAAKNPGYLVAFNRGRRISVERGAVWGRDGRYTGAREALDIALAQGQILGGVDDPPGVQVMTIHKSKGKKFDGVIVIREGGVKVIDIFGNDTMALVPVNVG